MTRTNDMDVLFEDQVIGRIKRQSGRMTFTYNEDWMASADSTPLSLSMPLVAQAHSHKAVNSYLWGLLPDNERVLERWGREFGVSVAHPLGLLAKVGEDLPGAVRIIESGSSSARQSISSVEWLEEQDVEELLGGVKTDETAWLGREAGSRWSLAGAQPKIALLYDERAGWGRPSGRSATNRILKPAILSFEDHDINEHLCLEAGRRLGLRTVRSMVKSFGEQRAVVIERFDRIQETGDIWRRVHQEDICQALAIHPENKYQNENGPGAKEVIELLRNSIANPDKREADVNAFVDALIFNWLILGPDAHAKNYSVLLSGPDVRLAPLYDIASAIPYEDVHQPKVRLAMRIGGHYSAARIDRRHWKAFAESCRVDPERVIDRAVAISERISDAFSDSVVNLEIDGSLPSVAIKLVDGVALRSSDCVSRLR